MLNVMLSSRHGYHFILVLSGSVLTINNKQTVE